MSWIKSDSELPRSPKFFDLVSRLKVGPQDAFWHLHHLWYWCSDHHHDGVLKDISDLAIALSAQWPGDPKAFVDALVESGFIDRNDGALFIHNWDRRRSDPVRLKSRRVSDIRPTIVGQEEKRESFLPAPSLSPTPPISSPFSLSKERKEEDSAADATVSISKTERRKAIPNWAPLVDHIKRRWEYKKRPHGRFNPTGKDFKHLRDKAMRYDAFELMALYDEFIVIEDVFYTKNGFAVWVFCGAIDFLVDRPGWKSKSEKYRHEYQKPVTTEEISNAKKLSSVIADMSKGRVQNQISSIRKQELKREGLVA